MIIYDGNLTPFVERHPWVVLDPDGYHYTRWTNSRAAIDHAQDTHGEIVAPAHGTAVRQ